MCLYVVGMSYLLEHLRSGWEVDCAIQSDENNVVVVRFGKDNDAKCMVMDEILSKAKPLLANYAKIYAVDIGDVTDFNQMYELTDPCTLMFFYKNKHIQVDCGTGNNNKITFPLDSTQQFIDLVEVVYRGATKGRGLVQSPYDFSSKSRY